MSLSNLTNIDLKSLRVLAQLLQEPNITAVANKMAMQPAGVTYHLNKLRSAMDDPLLVQVGREMVPTKKALSLMDKLDTLLCQFDELMRCEKFDPKTITQSFTIALQDIAAVVLIPVLLSRLATLAPNAVIKVLNWPANIEQQLLEGSVDIAINAIDKPNNQLYGYQLGNMKMSIVTRRSHPLANKEFKLSEVFDYPHVRVEPLARGQLYVDELAHKLGKKRKVVMAASTFAVLSSTIEHSDIVGIFASEAAKRLAKEGFFTKDVEEIPLIPLHCFWHQRVHHEPAHQFLRNLIIEISKELFQDEELVNKPYQL
ncbi:LysR substrate-binding domain-containing protein [Vibrio kyushuensis]|uniref:LysR substrate-binding domain-containing protein n=1 Tax=Vibrio kyushuensis TaxID=2910249 RepID=UPI003D0AF9EF